jgi:PPIC-type PPIASE domain
LARAYSDDVVTKDRGGSLGGVRAGQIPAEYRDALAELKPGEISRVVKTSAGYDVLVRRPMPVDGAVAGRRIVIRYRGTVGGPAGSKSGRTRDAALDLAVDVASEARKGQRPFEDLVQQYSENADR